MQLMQTPWSHVAIIYILRQGLDRFVWHIITKQLIYIMIIVM